MNIYWIYNISSLSLCLLTLLVAESYALLGLFAVRPWLRKRGKKDESHNHVVSFCLATVTVMYGITLGLMANGAWTNFTETDAQTSREAACMTAVWRDASVLPENTARPLQAGIRKYTRYLIDQAWPLQQQGKISNSGAELLNSIQVTLLQFHPATLQESQLYEQALTSFNRLTELRRIRQVNVQRGLPSAIWVVMIGGALLCLCVTWFFDIEDTTIHVLTTAITAAMIAILIFLIAALDNPYRGSVSVRPDAFALVYQEMDQ